MSNRLDFFLNISLLFLIVIFFIILSIKKVKKFVNSSSVKNYFLIFPIIFAFIIFFSFIRWLLIGHHFYSMSLVLGSFLGIVYSYIEFRFFIIKKVRDSCFYNDSRSPSIFLALIVFFGIMFLLCLFHPTVEWCRVIRNKAFYLTCGFIIFYCLVFYLGFNKLENKKGTIYFKKKIIKW